MMRPQVVVFASLLGIVALAIACGVGPQEYCSEARMLRCEYQVQCRDGYPTVETCVVMPFYVHNCETVEPEQLCPDGEYSAVQAADCLGRLASFTCEDEPDPCGPCRDG